MVAIQITYPIWLLGQQKHKVSVPQSWNELTKDQLCRVAALLYSGKSDLNRIRIELLRILMRLKWHHLFLIGGDRLIDLFPYVAFIEKDITLTDNKVLSFAVDNIRFFGPMRDFSTLTAEEWTDADEAYTDCHPSLNPEALDRFIAILFRERKKGMWQNHSKWSNDYRRPYQEHELRGRVRHIAKIPQPVKLAVLLWWKGCRREWEDVFERVFKSKEQQGPQSFGWQETILKLSGSEFGDLEKTQRTYMYKLMLKMEVTIKDEEYRIQHEKAQRNAH